MSVVHFNSRPCIIMIMACCLLTLNRQTAAAEDWTQWGGPDRDFSTMAASFGRKTDFSTIKEKWRIPIGSGNSGICVRGDVAFTCFTENGQEQIIAVSTIDGREIWKRTFEVPTREFMDLEYGLGPHATPLVTDKLLFCIGLTGRMSALDIASGNTVWEKQLWANGKHTELHRGFAASPVAFKDTIIVPVGGDGRSVRCFAMADGAVRWQKHDFVCAYASPLIAKLARRFQVILLMDQSLVGLDPKTGELLWNHPVPTRRYVNCTSPVIGPNDTIFINTGEGLRGLQLSFQNNQFKVNETWASRITISQTSNFVFREGIIYGAKEGSVFAAVDAITGRTLWQSRELKDCSVTAAGEHLIAVQENGQLVVAKVSPKGVEAKWRKRTLSGRCWVGPVVANGLLLVRDSEKLLAFALP